MKTVFVFFTALLFLSACSNDAALIIDDPSSTTSLNYERVGDTLPMNSDNPYDAVGALHYELFSSYYETATAVTDLDTLIQQVETLAYANPSFLSLQGHSFQPVTATRIQSILTQPNHLDLTLSTSGISESAQDKLKDFVAVSLEYCDESYDFDTVYAAIVAYETAVLADTDLTMQEQEILLVTSSVIRHSIYTKKKKRPKRNTDPEWDMLVSTFRGAADGAVYDKGSSLLFSLVGGIWENR